MDVNVRERFELFFSIQFEEVARYSDFILMQMREQTNPGKEEMFGLINELRQKTYEMQERMIVDVYGDKICGHMHDFLVLLGRLTKGYIEFIIFTKDLLDYKGLASYIVERTDSIVNGLTEPFLKTHQLIGNKFMESNAPVTAKGILREIALFKQNSKDEEVIISLDVIEQELSSKVYRKPVISGMMSNLKNNPLLEDLLNKLTFFLESTGE